MTDTSHFDTALRKVWDSNPAMDQLLLLKKAKERVRAQSRENAKDPETRLAQSFANL